MLETKALCKVFRELRESGESDPDKLVYRHMKFIISWHVSDCKTVGKTAKLEDCVEFILDDFKKNGAMPLDLEGGDDLATGQT